MVLLFHVAVEVQGPESSLSVLYESDGNKGHKRLKTAAEELNNVRQELEKANRMVAALVGNIEEDVEFSAAVEDMVCMAVSL